MKRFLIAILLMLPVVALSQPSMYRRSFTGDSIQVNTLLTVGTPSQFGGILLYGSLGSRLTLVNGGTATRLIFFPDGNGMLGFWNQLGGLPIDFTGIGPGKMPIWNGTNWVVIDTSLIGGGGGGGSSFIWGAGTGTLDNQTDLKNKFLTKLDVSLDVSVGGPQGGYLGGTDNSGVGFWYPVSGDVGFVFDDGLGQLVASIGNNKVNTTQMQQVATATLLGRSSAGTGNMSPLTQLPFINDTLHGGTGAATAWQGLNGLLPQSNRVNGYVPIWNSVLGRIVLGPAAGGGSLLTAGLTGTAEMAISNSPLTGAGGTIGLAWTPGQPAAKVLATPPGATGIPSLQSLTYPYAPWVRDSIIAHAIGLGLPFTGGKFLKTYHSGTVDSAYEASISGLSNPDTLRGYWVDTSGHPGDTNVVLMRVNGKWKLKTLYPVDSTGVSDTTTVAVLRPSGGSYKWVLRKMFPEDTTGGAGHTALHSVGNGRKYKATQDSTGRLYLMLDSLDSIPATIYVDTIKNSTVNGLKILPDNALYLESANLGTYINAGGGSDTIHLQTTTVVTGNERVNGNFSSTTIQSYFGTGADSGATVSGRKFSLNSQNQAIIIDSVQFSFYSGSSPGMTPTISYGPDINATGTSFGSFSEVTASLTTVHVPSATTVPRGQDVWISWAYTSKPWNWRVTIWGHE